MSRLCAALLLCTWTSTVHADVPPGITKRIVDYIFESCEYLHANGWQPHQPRPSEKKLAEHFGKITSAKREGLPTRYALKAAAFPEWDVSFWNDWIRIKLPPQVAITMGDLQRYLGPDSPPDVMYAMSATPGGEPPPTADREFTPPENRPACRVSVQTENDLKKGAARRVFKIEFTD